MSGGSALRPCKKRCRSRISTSGSDPCRPFRREANLHLSHTTDLFSKTLPTYTFQELKNWLCNAVTLVTRSVMFPFAWEIGKSVCSRQPPFPHQIRNESPLKPDYTFDKFVEGSSNTWVRNIALEVATQPSLKFNPFFIYGGVGLRQNTPYASNRQLHEDAHAESQGDVHACTNICSRNGEGIDDP